MKTTTKPKKARTEGVKSQPTAKSTLARMKSMATAMMKAQTPKAKAPKR